MAPKGISKESDIKGCFSEDQSLFSAKKKQIEKASSGTLAPGPQRSRDQGCSGHLKAGGREAELCICIKADGPSLQLSCSSFLSPKSSV